MAQRRNKCPECSSYDLTVVEELNPNTTDLNMRAKLRCEDCEHEWEGRITSHHYQRQREMGFVI